MGDGPPLERGSRPRIAARASRWTYAAVASATSFASASCARSPRQPEPLRVAAAADLSAAFDAIAAAYERDTGQKVVVSYGATGLLERQIVEGAPFDVFAAADVSFVDRAIGAGACLRPTKQTYAYGHLVMVPRAGIAVASIEDLADARIARIAIANPEHAPYGRAARAALERAGVWSRVEHRIVYGENVRQALQFAESGNADVAIVAASLARGDASTRAVPVAATLYDPLEQAMVACSHGRAGPQAGARFCAYVASAPARNLLSAYGFSPPDAAVAESGPR